MDFTKTTEIDISSMHDSMEEATPKKNNAGKIISMILSLLIAFIIWVYAFENDPTIEKDIYYDVPVINSTEYVNVWVEGTNSQLADLKKEYIEVTFENGTYSAQITIDDQPRYAYKCTVEVPSEK
ncbi:MAG: hypothetical protein IJ400_01290 [Clostridia bacterium]|nr:hypothetical protein [Clostridia bacterium]